MYSVYNNYNPNRILLVNMRGGALRELSAEGDRIYYQVIAEWVLEHMDAVIDRLHLFSDTILRPEDETDYYHDKWALETLLGRTRVGRHGFTAAGNQQKLDEFRRAVSPRDVREALRYLGRLAYLDPELLNVLGVRRHPDSLFLLWCEPHSAMHTLSSHYQALEFGRMLLNLKVKKIQSLYRGNKSRLLSKAEGRITNRQKIEDWPKIRQSMLDEGFTAAQIQSFYDNIYMPPPPAPLDRVSSADSDNSEYFSADEGEF